MLYPLSYQATWIDGQLWVRDIPDDSEIYKYEYMKIIYVNCGWNMSEIWSSQWAFNLSSWKSNLKKIQAWMGFEPMTLRYRCNALSTELPSHMDRWSIVSSWYTRWQWNIWIWIYENHICELRMKHEWNLILAVGFQLKQLKKQPEKNSGLNGIRTHDLAIPVQCSIHWATKPHG